MNEIYLEQLSLEDNYKIDVLRRFFNDSKTYLAYGLERILKLNPYDASLEIRYVELLQKYFICSINSLNLYFGNIDSIKYGITDTFNFYSKKSIKFNWIILCDTFHKMINAFKKEFNKDVERIKRFFNRKKV